MRRNADGSRCPAYSRDPPGRIRVPSTRLLLHERDGRIKATEMARRLSWKAQAAVMTQEDSRRRNFRTKAVGKSWFVVEWNGEEVEAAGPFDSEAEAENWIIENTGPR